MVLGHNRSFRNIGIKPKPVENIFTLDYYLPGRGKINIRIIDSKGSEFYNMETLANPGLSTMKINSESLAQGIYFILLNSDGMNLQFNS